MTRQATPLLIEQPRSSAGIADALQRLLETAGFAPGSDPLLSALVHVAARHGEILSECINAVPAAHLRAFSEFLPGCPRPAVAARVHLSFRAATGSIPVVVPMHTRVAAAPIAGEAAPVVFETSEDLEVVRADCVQAWFVDAGHRHVADVAAMLAAPGRGDSEAPAVAPVVFSCHIAQREALAAPGLREVRLQFSFDAPTVPDPQWQLEWSLSSAQGELPLRVLSDTTGQLSRDGEILLQAPREWPLALVAGIESRWVTARLRVAAGVASASLGALRWPRVRALALHISAATAPQPALAACHGAALLDTSKDFFPFGERPRFGEVLHLLSPAFGQPGAHVELRIQMSNPAGASGSPIAPVSRDGKPLVAWEMYTLAGWRRLSASDGSRSLTEDGTLTFTVPPDVTATAIAGKTGFWLRARLLSGNYGSSVASEFAALTLPNAPSIRELAVLSSLQRGPLAPDCIVRRGALTSVIQQSPLAGPFAIVVAPDSDGAALYIAIDAGAATFAGALKPGRELSLHVRPAPPRLPVALDALAATPAPRWQLRGANGWHDIAVRDESNGLTRSGIVRLQLAQEVAPWSGSELDAKAQFAWLRLVWPGPVDAARALPIGLALNSVLATQTQCLRDEILGSSNGRSSQVFKALRTPIVGDVLLQVREDDDAWLLWNEVDDLGSSPPAARHFTLDRSSGEVRFGDGRHGSIPPGGANNVRLHVYACGGGSEGNRPALTISQLRSAIPAITGVLNLEPALGGLDAENGDDMREHASAWLRHRDRAVCADDFADLARKASAEVARAYSLAGRDLAATPAAVPEPGVISVVVIPQGSDARPQPRLDLLAQVRDYLDARRSPAVRLVLVGPTYAAVSVQLAIGVAPGWSAHAVRADCAQRIERFLHPLAGGSDGSGWPLGRRPHRSDLFALAAAVDGVAVVRSVRLRVDAISALPFVVAAGTIDVVASAAGGA